MPADTTERPPNEEAEITRLLSVQVQPDIVELNPQGQEVEAAAVIAARMSASFGQRQLPLLF